MKKRRGISSFLAVAVLAIVLLLSISGQAGAQLTYYFGESGEFGSGAQWGGVAPSGIWATATFMDVGGNVELTLSVDGSLPSGQFIGEWYFNYNGDASSLSIDDNGGGATTTTIGQLNDGYQADGDGLYDLWFNFDPQGNNKLTAGESMNYTIYGVTSSDFYLLAAPGTGSNGPFYAATKLQGISCDTNIAACAAQGGTTSTWAAGVVPEPVSSTLFIVGAATLGFRRFRKKFRK